MKDAVTECRSEVQTRQRLGWKAPAPGLYVHVPFCREKCRYCAFFSLPSLRLLRPWMKALVLEMERYRGHFAAFDSLYVGGGTPSTLPIDALVELVKRLERCFDLHPACERTVEINPSDVSAAKVQTWRSLGFNRVSLGVQSWEDGELRFLGRDHTAREAREAYHRLRQAGFENIGVDLIYGLPGQERAAWMRNLERTVALGPEHVSCYQLSFEPRTPLGRLAARGSLAPLQEGLAVEMFCAASEFLSFHGYLHYEVSNFARGLCRCSRHNRKYWTHVPYLGLGPAAHSFNARVRWWNVASVRRYVAALAEGRAPVEGKEDLDREALRLERMALGFRTREGVARVDLPRESGSEELLARLEAEGTLRCTPSRVIPTVCGFLVADALSAAMAGCGSAGSARRLGKAG